jgi:hypothetical protein
VIDLGLNRRDKETIKRRSQKMTTKPQTLSELFAEEEAARIAAANTPEALAEEELRSIMASAKFKEEFDRGVRLGWFDEEGNVIFDPEEADEDSEEEEGEGSEEEEGEE